MRKYLIKNKKKRFLFLKNELLNLILKSQIYNNFNLKNKKIIFIQKLNNKTKNFNFKNICILTGRTRSVFSKYKLSRIKLRELINMGLLLGFKKASW